MGVELLVAVWTFFTRHGGAASTAPSATAPTTLVLLAGALALSVRLPHHARV